MKNNDELSTALQITNAVPQGSVIGHLLFILYVKNLFRVLPSFLTITYTDGTYLLSSDTNFKNSVNVGNSELKLYYGWALSYRISINVDKTFYIMNGDRLVAIDAPSCVMGNVPMEKKEYK